MYDFKGESDVRDCAALVGEEIGACFEWTEMLIGDAEHDC